MTAMPTMQPITSLVPTSAPSFTGLVASFDVTKVVTSALSDSEINAIEAEVMENFEVTEDEIDTTGNLMYILMNINFEIVESLIPHLVQLSLKREM